MQYAAADTPSPHLDETLRRILIVAGHPRAMVAYFLLGPLAILAFSSAPWWGIVYVVQQGPFGFMLSSFFMQRPRSRLSRWWSLLGTLFLIGMDVVFIFTIVRWGFPWSTLPATLAFFGGSYLARSLAKRVGLPVRETVSDDWPR